jgi:AbrB family looped-hinge helix DNA binding protein
MSAMLYTVSERGQMALPAAVRRRWGLADGGQVEVLDLGGTVLIAPAGDGGFRAMLRTAISEAGGYDELVARVIDAEPELA